MPKPTSQPLAKYEVRQVKAWAGDEEGAWNWNQSWHMGFMYTRCDTRKSLGKALTHYLKTKHKITFKVNRTRIEGNFDLIEIVDRKDYEPLFAAIWTEEDVK